MVTSYESGIRSEEDGRPITFGPSTADRASAHPSTAAIAGHPLHPMVVPIPIGLLTAAAVSDLAYGLTRDAFWARASRWLLGGGLVSGVMAATLGIVEFVTIPQARRRSGVAHAGGNAAILGLTGISLLLRRDSRRSVPTAAMGLTLLATMMLMVTGWLGGELTYRHGIGVLPDEER